MAIDEVEAERRFGEKDAAGKKPTMATIKARAEREKAMDEKQRMTLEEIRFLAGQS